MANKDTVCFVWNEAIARKGSNEVASALMYYIESLDLTNVEEIIFWSDNCPGQNKNRIVYSFYAWAADRYKINITHRFLEKGHTQNEGDSVHATIERAAKNKSIYIPNQWYSLIHSARKSGKPYEVVEMLSENFYNFKSLCEKLKWKTSIKGDKISYNDTREVQIKKDSVYNVCFKNDLNGEIHTVEIYKPQVLQRGRKAKHVFDNLDKLYEGALPVNEAKLKDLQYLCKNNFIPIPYHYFYNNLASSKNNIDDDDDDEE